jgi:hypothetical protein
MLDATLGDLGWKTSPADAGGCMPLVDLEQTNDADATRQRRPKPWSRRQRGG